MEANELNHNFGYGNGIDNEDSKINKLKVSDIKDLKIYVNELIISQIINTTLKNSIIRKDGFSDIKLVIEVL